MIQDMQSVRCENARVEKMAEKPPAIPSALKKLDLTISEATKLLADLKQKLQPILSSEPEGLQNGASRPNAQCELADQIEAQAYSAGHLVGCLATLIRCIEL